MNILMMTNTFSPHVGGVARSIQSFADGFRKKGHRVLVVAPEYEQMPEIEKNVIRIPAIKNFNRSDFSVMIPIPGFLTSAIENFKPDIVHTHHPFLIGNTALRVAHIHKIPLVFTHHTMYEQYTHYSPIDSISLKRFVIDLSTRYANLCDYVFAPSESIASILINRKVETPIDVIPTGVHIEQFNKGSGAGFRMAMNIPEDAFVVGHVGRLALEKNLQFLSEAIAAFLKTEGRAHFLVVGGGPYRKTMQDLFFRKGIPHLAKRLHFTGSIDFPLLASAYKAMDVFAFASKSETQGMVLTEAMAAGIPVVALDAPGVRDIVVDQCNGMLLQSENAEIFASILAGVSRCSKDKMQEYRQDAEKTARMFSMEHSMEKTLNRYQILLGNELSYRHDEFNTWIAELRLVKTDWDVLKGMFSAAGTAFFTDYPKIEKLDDL